MAYVPVDVPAFGGLDLRDPEDASGSPDLLNISFSKQDGTLGRAPGLTAIGSLNHYYPTSMYNSEATSKLLVAGSSTNLSGSYIRAENYGGTSTAVTTSYGVLRCPWSIVDAPSVSSGPAAFLANGTDCVVRFAGSTLTTLSASCSTKVSGGTSFSAYNRAAPKARALCVQLPDRRLVAAGTYPAGGPNGVTSYESHVWFSQPDDAEKWDETDYVDLGYDGQKITAAVSWGNQVFVFKKTKMFVFYGNSTDADGGTVFNYRTVDNAFPGNDTEIYQGQICVAPDGLYVWTAQGVFFTNGGPPRLVGDPIQRMFTSTVSGYSAATRSLSELGSGTGGALYYKGTLYWAAIGAQGEYTYTLCDGKWSRVITGYGLAANSNTLYASATSGIVSVTDSGTASSAYYVSPYSTFGAPGVEKTVRQTELHGSGTVDVSWGKDLQSHGYAKSVTMLNGRGLDRTAVRGESLSWKVSGTGAWSLNRVVPFLREQRASGVKT